MRAMILEPLTLALVAWLAFPGCGDDAKCARELCDPASFGAVCVGHAVQTCAPDGQRFIYTACGDQQRCDAGACVARQCTTLGRSTCATVTSVERCKDDGSGLETIACADDETCKDGACVPTVCAGEADRCTDHGLVRCQDNAWVQDNCAAPQLCVVSGGGTARCTAPVCTPEARRCDGDTVKVCDARGMSETTEACAGGEVCVDGGCQVAVCGVDGADTSDAGDTTDTIDGETSEPKSQILFTLNGVASTFDLSAFATFDSGKRTVTIHAQKSTRELELKLTPAPLTVSGSFSSEVFNPVKVVVCYDEGGSPANFEECEGYTHRSVAYDLEITRNDGVGGRLVGTFSATLEDQNTDQIQLQAGQIDVKYR